MDTMSYTKKTTGTAKRTWTQGQEFQQNEDEYESWDNFLEKELHSLMMDQAPGKGKGKGMGKGKEAEREQKGRRKECKGKGLRNVGKGWKEKG